MNLLENIPLAPLTTMGVGGPARYLVEAASAGEVCDAVAFARQQSLPLFVLGAGSNVVVSDAGFSGLVLKPIISGIRSARVEESLVLTVGAGEDWDDFVAHAVAADAAGLECLSGIPGTVGATPVQNVGAYGQEVSDTISALQALDTVSGKSRTFNGDQCAFTYRGSRFNAGDSRRYVILSVTFKLTLGAAARISYADLRKFFGDGRPSLQDVRQAVLQLRQAKGMLLGSGPEDLRSAGSFFKNPVLSSSAYRALQERTAAEGLSLPSYPALASQHKVPAAWLVEQAGFAKGYIRGAVGISPRHALAIVNLGGATAAEIIALRDDIQRAVRDRFGIELHPEPVFLGFAPGV